MNKMKVRRILLLVIILLSSVSFLLSETNEEKANKHFDLGFEYGDSQKWDEAIEEYKLAIKYKPDFVVAHYNLGNAYGIKGLIDKAIEEYKLAIKYKPDDAEAHYLLGFTYRFKVLTDKAIKEFKLAIKYKPDFADAHYNLGIMYGNKGLTDKAIDEYKLAIKYKPNYAEAHYLLGSAYRSKGLADKAIEEYKLAIKYKPNYAEAHLNLGIVYVSKDLTDKAIDKFKLAIKYKLNYADAHYELGVSYGIKDRTTTSADYFYRAGLLYLQQNNRESVLRTIDAMKDYAPNSPLISLLTEKLYANNDSISKNENVQYSGSGFIIDKTGLIVTNYHIIKGMKNIEIYIPSRDIQYKAEILIKDINNDIVILKINDHKFVKEFINIPFSMGSSSVIKEGQDIFTIGFPMKDVLGKSAKLSTGIISSLYGFLDNPTLVQISNPIQPGNSGSPLFNSNGEVVGIVVSSLSASYFYENEDIIPQNVNFAIKVDYLKNIISIINNGDKILSRKSQIRNLPLETQFKKIKPFIVIVKAY